MAEHPATFRHLGQAQPDDLMGFHLADAAAQKVDGTALGFEQAGNGVHGGSLAGAVCADQGHDLALVHMERDILDGMDGAIEHIQIAYAKHLTHGQSPPRYAAMTLGLLRMDSPLP